MKKLLIALLTVCCVCLNLTALANPKLTVKDEEIKQNDNFLLVYPKVTLDGKQVIGDKINTYFARDSQMTVQRYQEERAKGIRKTFEQKYTQSYYGKHYLCFLYDGYMFYKGAAHPLSWRGGVTFDLKTGADVKWQDLIKDGDKEAFTLSAINDKIFNSKEKWRGWLFRDFQGLKKLPKTYYLDTKGYIHFIFGQYEIAPYAAGIIDLNMEKQCK